MSDRILGAVGVVVGAGMAWAARDYVAPISYQPVGPSSFPLLMAGLMTGVGAWMVVKPGPLAFGMARAHIKPFLMSVVVAGKIIGRWRGRWAGAVSAV